MARRLSYAAGVAFIAAMAVIAVMALGPATARDAEAHAALVRSNPSNGERVARAPLNVVLNFSEPIERKLTKIVVSDKDGNRVDDGEIEFDDADAAFASIGLNEIGPGLYIVEFDNVSTVDGHPWNGVVQFIVLNPDGTVPEGAEFDPDASTGSGGTGLLPKKVDAALKWISLLSLAVVAGAAFWVLVVARPGAAFLEDEEYQKAVGDADQWLARYAHPLLVLAFIAMAALVVITVQRFETATSLGSYLTSIRTGQYRLLFALSIVLALLSANVVYLAAGQRIRGYGAISLLLWSLVALLTFSLTSHGAADGGAFWAVTSDYIHLLASAAWLGALAMLLPFLRFVKRELDETERFLYMANVFDRFSIVAGLSVIAVLSTGTFNGLAQIPSVEALYETTYGRVLLVKLALMLPLLAVAGVNAFILKPRLINAIDDLYQSGGKISGKRRDEEAGRLSRIQRALPVTIAAEIALVAAVFGAVAVLTLTSTAKGEIAQEEAQRQLETEFTDEKPAGDLLLNFTIQPNRVGLNQYELVITNDDGTPASELDLVRLRFFYTDPTKPDLAVGQTELILNEFEPGAYRGSGAYFSQPGSWRVEAGIRRAGEDDVSRNFVVSVAPSEAGSAGDGGRFALPFTSFDWNEVLGVLAMILGATAMLYAGHLGRALGVRDRWVGTAGVLIAASGFVLAYAVQTGGAGNDLAAGNPIEPTEESIGLGRTLFNQNCMVCHGTDGRGDGPQAADLDPAPTDFRLHLPLHNDAQFFAFIANGYPGSAMPAWREQLSDDDIWNLVNFLRSEFSEAPNAISDPE